MRADVLAIDQGTTSVRASVVDGSLTTKSTASEPLERAYPAPGWVEIDAEQVVRATERVAAHVLGGAGAVAGLGLANQGETAVVWERATGRPIAPAIGWQCRRTEARCATLRARGLGRRVEALTGLPIDAYFSASKIAWLLDATPGARQRAQRGELCAGTLDSYTIFRLSGGEHFVTDPSTACRTQLAELASGRFSEELCAIFDVPISLLGEVIPSDASVATVRLGGRELRVGAMLCDQPAALLGTGCLAPGEGKCTYGTGAFVQANTGRTPTPGLPSEDGLLRSIAWELGGARSYLLEGSVLAAGDVVRWLADDMHLLTSPSELGALLRRTPSSQGLLFAPAIAGLGAPHWASGARGGVLGLHGGSRPDHLIRAAVEGIAHRVADVLEAASGALGRSVSPMFADGGLASCAEFLAIQADLAGTSLCVGGCLEATTRGVAAVALVSAGCAGSVAALVRQAPQTTISPTLSEESRRRARERHRGLIALLTSAAALDLLREG